MHYLKLFVLFLSFYYSVSSEIVIIHSLDLSQAPQFSLWSSLLKQCTKIPVCSRGCELLLLEAFIELVVDIIILFTTIISFSCDSLIFRVNCNFHCWVVFQVLLSHPHNQWTPIEIKAIFVLLISLSKWLYFKKFSMIRQMSLPQWFAAFLVENDMHTIWSWYFHRVYMTYHFKDFFLRGISNEPSVIVLQHIFRKSNC